MLELLRNYLVWLALLFSLIYFYLKYRIFNYWKHHGIPYEEPGIVLGNIPFSHFLDKISIGTFLRNSYQKFHQYPFYGFYAFYQPVLVINNPDLIRTVLVKEFSSFSDRGWFSNKDIDPISGHLFLLSGEKWKRLRKQFSPMFSSTKLKRMYNFIADISDNMVDVCNSELKKSEIVEVKKLVDRYTVDIITSTVYGLNANSLRNSDSEFYDYANKLFDFGKLVLLMCIFVPKIVEKCCLPMNKNCVLNFFLKTFENAVECRRNKKVMTKDMLNLLMQLVDNGELKNDNEGKFIDSSKRDEENSEKLSITDAAAQAFVFFAAGYETASSTASYCLYELALNQVLQERLRKEIDDIYNTSEMTYDNLMGMEYLEMVFLETLRKHSPLPFLNRICVKDFVMPDSNFMVPKGMPILISIAGVHYNPEYFPNPEVFDPLRFTKENIASRNHYVQLGFGEGPRYCIGKKFGEIQAKQAIVAMIRNFKIDICDKTDIPMGYTSHTFVQKPRRGVYLRIQKRQM